MIEKIKSQPSCHDDCRTRSGIRTIVGNARAAAPGTTTMTVTAVGKKNTSPPLVNQGRRRALFEQGDALRFPTGSTTENYISPF